MPTLRTNTSRDRRLTARVTRPRPSMPIHAASRLAARGLNPSPTCATSPSWAIHTPRISRRPATTVSSPSAARRSSIASTRPAGRNGYVTSRTATASGESPADSRDRKAHPTTSSTSTPSADSSGGRIATSAPASRATAASDSSSVATTTAPRYRDDLAEVTARRNRSACVVSPRLARTGMTATDLSAEGARAAGTAAAPWIDSSTRTTPRARRSSPPWWMPCQW